MFLRKEAIDLIKEICSRYKNEPSPLMLILADVQKEYGYIPLEVQEIISNETNIPVSDIYGVVTFYSFFSGSMHSAYYLTSQHAEPPSSQSANHSANQQVARIMKTKIKARIRIGKSPQQNKNTQTTLPKQTDQKKRQSKRIGRMTRRKAKTSSPLSIDNVDQLRNRIIRMGRSQTTYQRTYHTITHLIGKRNGKSNSYRITKRYLPMKVSE